MRPTIFAVFMLVPTATGSWAEERPILCLYEKTAAKAVAACKIENLAQRAIAKIAYRLEVVSDGREVPWASDTGEIVIPGGVEPAEKLTLGFDVPALPERAPTEGIKVKITAARFIAVDGTTIFAYPTNGSPEGLTSAPPMTAGEKEAVVAALKSCWNTGALSSEAAKTRVTIRIDMQPNGKPVLSSVALEGYEGSSEQAARQAYEAARRAIVRCGSEGLPLPAEKFGWWQQIELVFDPSELRMQ